MGNVKTSFVLYTQIAETLKELTDEEKGQLFQAILDYQTTGEVPELNRVVKMAFIPIMQDLDANNEKWEKTRQARSRAGQYSANKRQQKATNSTHVDFVEQKATNSTVNVNDNVNVNVNVNDNNVIYKRVSKDTLVRIVEDFNSTCTSFPKVSTLSDTRKKHLKARLALHSEDELHTAFWKIEQSDFAKNGGWCGFDWLIKSENNLIKVLEGNYDNRDPQETPDKYEVARAKINNMFGGQA